MKVFLGGTCNESTWRKELEPLLEIDYFNPVVDDWDDEAFENELREKEICDVFLIHITPKMTGVFSIAEVIESVFKDDKITIFSYQVEDGTEFDEFQIKSLDRVCEMVDENDGISIADTNMGELASVLNEMKGDK